MVFFFLIDILIHFLLGNTHFFGGNHNPAPAQNYSMATKITMCRKPHIFFEGDREAKTSLICYISLCYWLRARPNNLIIEAGAGQALGEAARVEAFFAPYPEVLHALLCAALKRPFVCTASPLLALLLNAIL